MVTLFSNHNQLIRWELYRPKGRWIQERCSHRLKISAFSNRRISEVTARAQTASHHSKFNMVHKMDCKTSKNSTMDFRETNWPETSSLRAITLSINSNKLSQLPTLTISSKAHQLCLDSRSSHNSRRLNSRRSPRKPNSNRVTMAFHHRLWLTCSSRWLSEYSNHTLTTFLAPASISARRNTSSSHCIPCSCSRQRAWEPILINRQLNLHKSKLKSMIKA